MNDETQSFQPLAEAVIVAGDRERAAIERADARLLSVRTGDKTRAQRRREDRRT